MLKTLNVKNLAIIEDLEISFSNNFTVLTGETGAGKSLIIDSLNLIFGKRADNDLIRYGKEEAYVKAHFINLNENTINYLKAKNLNYEELIVERILSNKGNNKVLINNNLVSLQTLKELAFYIGDIHEQHDTLNLINPETSLHVLDTFGNLTNDLNDYTILKYEYDEALKKYESALNKTILDKEKLEELKFIHDELTKANLTTNELTILSEQINTLTNQKEIVSNLSEAYLNINKIDEENTIYNALKGLKNIEKYNLTNFKERLESIYYELDDLKNELYNKLDEIKDVSLLELESLEERYYFIKDLEYKYHKDLEELITYINEVEEEIDKIENYDAYLDKLKDLKNNLYLTTYNKAKEISNKRKKTALLLKDAFISSLKELDINYCLFSVDFKEIELSSNGIDDVLFLISLNEGEPLKPFYKVASGGELSRSMFSLKMIYAKVHKLSLIVFDEIDLGISGNAALKVANALKELSKEMQVIAITHLPQVASKADYHYHITKETTNKRTLTKLTLLEKEERVYKLAYMLSGNELTEGAILHAKELLK